MKRKKLLNMGLCDEYHRIATINVKEVLNQQFEIEQLKQRIEFAKQAVVCSSKQKMRVNFWRLQDGNEIFDV